MDNRSKKTDELKEESIYYVGIGASAGGLEALQDMFKAMPNDTGMVFIVIQHLSPDYKSLMDELLARHTKMPIKIASEGMSTDPNTIYLIPPRKNLSIFHGKLYLEEQSTRKGLNLPIDIFFRSLAVDKEKNAIGVILSGTGSDGTLGIRAIKEAGGMVIVQDDQSAKFDGMPRSSISTGLVDSILPPGKIAEALLDYTKHPLIRKTNSFENILSKNYNTLTKIILILRDFCGIDFSYYKENTIIRRLERRVSINRFNTLEEYIEHFSESDKEKDTLYRELLIGVTRFFRDQDAFKIIEQKVLPEVFSNKKTVRIWTSGCSTGEEAYSLAMLLSEYIDKNKLNCEFKIFATDIDRHALEIAGVGFYPDSIVSDVEPHLLTKYFNKKENGYQVKDFLRKTVVFASHNLLKDPPFSKLDLLVCRNLFIYLKPEMQQKLLSMFYYSLSPGGYLFMGSSESIGEMSEAFDAIDSKWKIYRYKDNYKPPVIRDIVLPRADNINVENGGNQSLRMFNGIKLDKLMESTVAKILPPSVIVDRNDNIIHVINDMNPFFDIKPGKFSVNILSNLPNQLSLFVGNILRRLKLKKDDLAFEHISSLKGFEDARIKIEGRVVVLDDNDFYLLSFNCVKKDSKDEENIEIHVDMDKEVTNRVTYLEKELQMTKESLQATVEELETSNEELQSANEELIASNEELQSTNEELQSVNEELYTVNSEYQSKIEELTRLNGDLDNLLKNTEVGALYLDRNLCIRKITPIVTRITNILPSDIGRPISHIAVMNFYSDLISDVDKVAETLGGIEREIEDSKGNVWLVRVQPYRTEYNAVEGIMFTFVDISRLKEEQYKKFEATERLEAALKIGNMAWWEWDVKTGILIYDEKYATMLGRDFNDFPCDINKIRQLIHPDDYQAVIKSLENYFKGETEFFEATYRIRCKDGRYVWYYDKGIISESDERGNPVKIIGTVLDVTKIKGMELEIRKNNELLEKILDNSSVAKTMVDVDGNISYANRMAEEIFGITKDEIKDRTYDHSAWRITDLDGKDIPQNNLPFAILKSNKKPIQNYMHYIVKTDKEKVLLKISGVPIIGIDGNFEGAVFTIEVVK